MPIVYFDHDWDWTDDQIDMVIMEMVRMNAGLIMNRRAVECVTVIMRNMRDGLRNQIAKSEADSFTLS